MSTLTLEPHPLTAARHAAGLSQAQLAAHAGVCRETVSALEHGALPRTRTLIALASALRIAPGAILPATTESLAANPGSREKSAGGAAGDAPEG